MCRSSSFEFKVTIPLALQIMVTLSSLHSMIQFVVIFFLQINFSIEENVLGKTTDDFDFDGLPGAQHEFKVEVPPGKEECFFQKAKKGALFFLSYQVVRGGDREIDVFIADPQSEVFRAFYRRTEGDFEFHVDQTGPYSICIDNTFSRFTSKLVMVYIGTAVVAEYEKYSKEIAEIHLTASNFSYALKTVEKSLKGSLKEQAHSRMHVAMDWYRIRGNNYYVQVWSMFQCAIIITTSCLQVYFVRRLFRIVNVTPTSKPRA